MQNLLIEHPDVLEEYVDAPPVGAEGYSKLLAATGRASLPRLLSVRLAELYWPLVRGCRAFVESLALGYKARSRSSRPRSCPGRRCGTPCVAFSKA